MKEVRSVLRAFEILDSFQEGRSRSISEISQDLGIPKSTVFDLLSTLVDLGVLSRERGSNDYQLGNKLIELGNKARGGSFLNRVAAPYLKALRDEYDETVFLTVRDGDQAFYVDCYESMRRLRTYSTMGDRAPLYCTSVGKAILAFLPDDEIERYVGAVRLDRFTPNTIMDRELLREDLRRTRERGYSVDDMEHEDGVRCVGAPLRDSEGRVVGAISVSGFAQRITREREAQVAASVMRAAREISAALGFGPER
ncbi:MAG TPA: IclR family transcriptional regulator [Spirochaetales bacterium]|nr:IclR family transcriptional regulator [Spirochaetales bacterium]HRY55687.1 IclR family transcriptional regulator [Spirochaetia bacterium]HRZ65436.1 IclR family transcriptional regulator [Spirochaetia bacterium]